MTKVKKRQKGDRRRGVKCKVEGGVWVEMDRAGEKWRYKRKWGPRDGR